MTDSNTNPDQPLAPDPPQWMAPLGSSGSVDPSIPGLAPNRRFVIRVPLSQLEDNAASKRAQEVYRRQQNPTRHGGAKVTIIPICDSFLKQQDCQFKERCTSLHVTMNIDRAEKEDIHLNTGLAGLESASFPRLPPGTTIPLWDPSKSFCTSYASEYVYRTKGSLDAYQSYLSEGIVDMESPETVRMQHCNHYLADMCTRGSTCNFVHVVILEKDEPNCPRPAALASPSAAAKQKKSSFGSTLMNSPGRKERGSAGMYSTGGIGTAPQHHQQQQAQASYILPVGMPSQAPPPPPPAPQHYLPPPGMTVVPSQSPPALQPMGVPMLVSLPPHQPPPAHPQGSQPVAVPMGAVPQQPPPTTAVYPPTAQPPPLFLPTAAAPSQYSPLAPQFPPPPIHSHPHPHTQPTSLYYVYPPPSGAPQGPRQ